MPLYYVATLIGCMEFVVFEGSFEDCEYVIHNHHEYPPSMLFIGMWQDDQ